MNKEYYAGVMNNKKHNYYEEYMHEIEAHQKTKDLLSRLDNENERLTTPPTEEEVNDYFKSIGYVWEDGEHEDYYINSNKGFTIAFKIVGFGIEYYKYDMSRRRAITEEEHKGITMYLQVNSKRGK